MTRSKLSGAIAGVLISVAMLGMASCESAQRKAADEKAAADAENAEAESRSVADASLGKESEVLAHGDLALNGHEQVLVVNRFRSADSAKNANPEAIFVVRAALLEKNDGKWSEILRCDEHLKNTSGYLGGFGRARVSGWRLEYKQDTAAGLEMKFAPAEALEKADAQAGSSASQGNAMTDVRWNKNTKRYQSFDESHERYLTEIPTLETPESSLR